MIASHTKLTPDRDLVSLGINLSKTNFLEQETLPDVSAEEEIQPSGQNTHPRGHKAGASHRGVKLMRFEDGSVESPAGGGNTAILGNPGREIDFDPTAGQDQHWGRWVRIPSGRAVVQGIRRSMPSPRGKDQGILALGRQRTAEVANRLGLVSKSL